MIVKEVDERTAGWERDIPVFRVYIFGASHRGFGLGFDTATYDIHHADVLQALGWAQRAAAECDGLYAVAMVSQGAEGELGLTWLLGMDANDDESQPAFERMMSLRGRRVVCEE